MEEQKKSRKQVIISLVFVFLLIGAVVGISYAVWSRTFRGEKDNSLTAASVSFSYTESNTNNISLTDTLPISDNNGKKLSGDKETFDFTVSGNYGQTGNVLYDVYATPYDMTLSDKYVKVYLTDQNDNPVKGYEKEEVPTYHLLEDYKENGSNTKSKLLYSSELTPTKKSEDLRLRVWLSSSYGESGALEGNNPEESLTFAFKVNVKARI